jgi:hypothetical protein
MRFRSSGFLLFELTPDLPFGFAQGRLGLHYAAPFDFAQGRLFGAGV